MFTRQWSSQRLLASILQLPPTCFHTSCGLQVRRTASARCQQRPWAGHRSCAERLGPPYLRGHGHKYRESLSRANEAKNQTKHEQKHRKPTPKNENQPLKKKHRSCCQIAWAAESTPGPATQPLPAAAPGRRAPPTARKPVGFSSAAKRAARRPWAAIASVSGGARYPIGSCPWFVLYQQISRCRLWSPL